jgi:hypothetical protein
MEKKEIIQRLYWKNEIFQKRQKIRTVELKNENYFLLKREEMLQIF